MAELADKLSGAGGGEGECESDLLTPDYMFIP